MEIDFGYGDVGFKGRPGNEAYASDRWQVERWVKVCLRKSRIVANFENNDNTDGKEERGNG